MAQTRPAYCPACVNFGQECSPDPEEYNEPCDSFKEADKEADNVS